MKNTGHFIKPKGSKIILIEWLNNLEVLVIYKKKSFYQFIDDHELGNDPISEDWEKANGSAPVLEIDGVRLFVLIFTSKKDRIVVHECVHLTHNIFEAKGIDTGINNSEAIAYMTDFLFSKAKEILR